MGISHWKRLSLADFKTMCHNTEIWHKYINVVKTTSNEVQLGAQGRLVIPSALRKSLNLKPGDKLIAHQVGESLVLERREAIEKRLWALLSHIPKEVSLADELIAERRKEAQRENEK